MGIALSATVSNAHSSVQTREALRLHDGVTDIALQCFQHMLYGLLLANVAHSGDDPCYNHFHTRDGGKHLHPAHLLFYKHIGVKC